jgi:hypothetical protein
MTRDIRIPADEKQLVGLLRAAHALDRENAPTQHSQRTPKCPPLPRFPAGLAGGWTPQEQQHVDGCDYCQKVSRMFGPAPGAEDTVVDRAEDTALTVAAPGRKGQQGTWEERLKPWLPALLRRTDLPQTPDDLLTSLREQLSTLGRRRLGEALSEWLTVSIDPAFVSAAAVEQVLEQGAQGESPWATAVRSRLRQMGLRTPKDLLSVELPAELTGNPALPSYLRDLYREAHRTERAGLELFGLSATA